MMNAALVFVREIAIDKKGRPLPYVDSPEDYEKWAKDAPKGRRIIRPVCITNTARVDENVTTCCYASRLVKQDGTFDGGYVQLREKRGGKSQWWGKDICDREEFEKAYEQYWKRKP